MLRVARDPSIASSLIYSEQDVECGRFALISSFRTGLSLDSGTWLVFSRSGP